MCEHALARAEYTLRQQIGRVALLVSRRTVTACHGEIRAPLVCRRRSYPCRCNPTGRAGRFRPFWDRCRSRYAGDLGPALTYHLADGVDVHVVNGSYTFNSSLSANGNAYAGTIRLGGTAGWIDVAPFGGVFRLSLGGLANNARVQALARPSDAKTYTFNGTVYPAAALGNVNGNVTFNGLAPYVGRGFTQAHFQPHPGLSLFGHAGVAFSTPQTTLVASNPGAYAAYPALQNDLNAEKKPVQDAVNYLKTYPVVGIGLQYRF